MPVAVAVDVTVGVGVAVAMPVAVTVGVSVAVGGAVMSTEPPSVAPGTFWQSVLTKEALGLLEKFTDAMMLAPGSGWHVAVKAMAARVPSGSEARGAKRSTITRSNSPSVSPPSKVTEAVKAPGRLKVTTSGMPSWSPSVGSKARQVWSKSTERTMKVML